MSKSFYSLLALTALSTQSLVLAEATQMDQGTSTPCNSSVVLLPSLPSPDHYRITGEFLYLLPTVDDTYFVLNSGSSTTFPNGERENNDFSFSPAFRVGIEIAACDKKRELEAFYARLSTTQNSTIAGTNLWGTLGRPDLLRSFQNYTGTASSDLHLLYQNAEVNLSHQIANNYGTYLYVKPGVEFAYFRLHENYAYQITGGALGTIEEKSKTWGVGPQIALGLDCNLYQGNISCNTQHALSVTSSFAGGILMSRGATQHFQVLSGDTSKAGTMLDTHDEFTWKTIPALHARMGLNYLIQTTACGIALGVGYEFNTYIRALTRTSFPDDVADGLCTTDFYNFDVQGLYVSASISF